MSNSDFRIISQGKELSYPHLRILAVMFIGGAIALVINGLFH